MLVSAYIVALRNIGRWPNISLGLKYQRNDSTVRRFLSACGLGPLLFEVQNETNISASRLFAAQDRKIDATECDGRFRSLKRCGSNLRPSVATIGDLRQ